MFPRMNKRLIWPVFFLVLACALTWWTLQSPFWKAVQRVGGVMRLLHEEYVDAEAVPYERLGAEAIRGMVEALDPYSAYLPAGDFNRLEELSEGRYVGIGVTIEPLNDRVTVTRVFPDGPADKAGVLPGDQVLEIEGEDVREATTSEVSSRLRGPSGEAVAVTFNRPGEEGLIDLSLTRGPVKLRSVEDVALSPEGIGSLRITQFADRTAEEFRAAVDQLEVEGMRALLVDLRNNPGGLLRTSKDVAGLFFREGDLIVYTQGRDRVDREEFRASGEGARPGYPVAVLINEASASGAEIVSGAWQDAGIATVIGETSHGKGSVQSIYAFRTGDGLRQTTARYFLPSGRSIHEVGVAPDLEIPLEAEKELRLILQSRHAGRLSAEEFAETFDFLPDLIDPQREAAETHLLAQLNGQI